MIWGHIYARYFDENGHSGRVVSVFVEAEIILVNAYDYRTRIGRCIDYCGKFRRGAVYLYAVLG